MDTKSATEASGTAHWDHTVMPASDYYTSKYIPDTSCYEHNLPRFKYFDRPKFTHVQQQKKHPLHSSLWKISVPLIKLIIV